MNVAEPVVIRRRISFFVHDLAINPIGRAAALALALQPGWDVEVLGFLFSGTDVYEPYRDLFDYKALPCARDVPSVVTAIPRLARMATGDVVYGCKPLVTSLGPALYAARLSDGRRPLLLDVEDDEWVPLGTSWAQFVWRDLVKGWRHATAWKYTRAAHSLTRFADAITVSSRTLQDRYGGVLIRHGPDERSFDPDRADLSDAWRCRAEFNLPRGPRLALFAGLPQPHKGWDTLLRALQIPACTEWHLVLTGRIDHPDFQRAAAVLGPRCHFTGPLHRSRMPALLAAVDAVPVPQLATVFARSQIPAKALDAMAMAKPLIASRVGDLPEMLGDGARGWLVEPGDAAALGVALATIAADPVEARRRGARARAWFLREASASATRGRLEALVASLPAARLP